MHQVLRWFVMMMLLMVVVVTVVKTTPSRNDRPLRERKDCENL